MARKLKPIPMWRVVVNGNSMAHGPMRDDGERRHAFRMAQTYRDINPPRTRVHVEHRAADSNDWIEAKEETDERNRSLH